jgi:hypothetical protein
MCLVRQLLLGWLVLAAVAGVSPAQTFSIFGPEAAAKVTQLTGQVSVLKDSTPWALQVGGTVQVKQVIVTGADGFAIFEVSDGSTFEVYPNSQVIFRANPGNFKDLLDVMIGRIKVHIQKLSGQPNQNRIKTPTAVISVRGTIFDVAVEDESSTLVSVEEGQVEVRHALLPSKEPKVLNGGEYLRIYKDQPLAQSSPNRDRVLQQGLRAAAEALYRILYRAPAATGGGGPLPPASGGGGAPLPGDTETNAPPPPPPPPSETNPPPPPQ